MAFNVIYISLEQNPDDKQILKLCARLLPSASVIKVQICSSEVNLISLYERSMVLDTYTEWKMRGSVPVSRNSSTLKDQSSI